MRRLKLGRKAAQRIEKGNVWVYRGELQEEVAADHLEEALLVDERGRLLGSALIDGASPVPVRLYSRREEAFDLKLIESRLEVAAAWRKRVVGAGNTGYRLVFSEADGLPGLTVDRFGPALALQLNLRNYGPFAGDIVSALGGMIQEGPAIHCAVVEVQGVRSLLVGDADKSRPIYQLSSLQFEADLLEGPKTGAFLDQRENYQAAVQWVDRLGIGGRGLDLYSSSGGFAMNLAAKLSSVDAVDSAKSAVTRIEANCRRNGIENVRAIEADVKQFLRGLAQARQRYDCVIVDPPAFAKQAKQKEEANRAYYELNLRALSAVAPSGLYVSCSCSHAISESDLVTIVREAASESRRTLSLLEKRTQSLDHREILTIPETGYLKCLYFCVH